MIVCKTKHRKSKSLQKQLPLQINFNELPDQNSSNKITNNKHFFSSGKGRSKIQKTMLPPKNSCREVNVQQLLENAMVLLQQNKNVITNADEYKQLCIQYQQYKQIQVAQKHSFVEKTLNIKENIENLIVIKNDFQKYLSNVNT